MGYSAMTDLKWPIRLRLWLLVSGSWRWNAWVRDITAWMERRCR